MAPSPLTIVDIIRIGILAGWSMLVANHMFIARNTAPAPIPPTAPRVSSPLNAALLEVATVVDMLRTPPYPTRDPRHRERGGLPAIQTPHSPSQGTGGSHRPALGSCPGRH